MALRNVLRIAVAAGHTSGDARFQLLSVYAGNNRWSWSEFNRPGDSRGGILANAAVDWHQKREEMHASNAIIIRV